MSRTKIPTKSELIQLQKLYKTDEKIAERLGGVTPQLVAYWRRKKNIQRSSFPKFSEIEIREVWERFGDDYRCGLEIGISKAAFYNWRRKYGIKDRPAFLKLEQLELNLGGPNRIGGRKVNFGQQTIAQKIIASRAGVEKVDIGEIVSIEPDLVATHSDSGQIVEHFKEDGYGYVWNPNRILISLDYLQTFDNAKVAQVNKTLREFVRRQSIKHFYDIGEGACHQLVIENAHVLPGQFAISTDPYVSAYGAIDAFGACITPSEMAVVWATGRVSITTPETVKVSINGKPLRGVLPKDIALFVAKNLSENDIAGKIIEFYGMTVTQMSVSERFILCQLTTLMGAYGGICPFDSITRRYFLGRTKMPYRPLLADRDANYLDTYEFNISHVSPQIARPGSCSNISPVSELDGTPINQVVLGSCVGGRFEDLRIAADIIKGKRIHPEVRMIIYPGSRSIYLEALKKGIIRALIEAGAMVMHPGCGPCKGSYDCILAGGERCLTTSGRYPGIGDDSKCGEILIVSPATAAASALRGVITDPIGFVK
jgi:3-isopropylmalate/(R)-2-methylmalate dehydratase large subunit